MVVRASDSSDSFGESEGGTMNWMFPFASDGIRAGACVSG